MKKFKILFIVAIFTASFLPAQISAKVMPNENVTIEYLENGDYVETIITTTDTVTSRAAASKVGTKNAFYKNANGEIMWSVSINASFTYNGSTATCTNSWVTTTCPSKFWKVSDAIALSGGNSATAYATGKRYQNGLVIQTLYSKVTLNCSANGTLY